MHVFAFSARQGTTAARMPQQIQGPAMRERADILRKLDLELAYQYRNQFIDDQATVLIETTEQTQCSGLSERYFKVYIPDRGTRSRKNDLVTVTLKAHHDYGLISTAKE
jgi:tRNA A37 methylthiotransferase MiaB